MKIAILGSTGMLGSMVKWVLSQNTAYEVICPTHEFFDAETVSPSLLTNFTMNFAYVVNCVGVIKPNINEQNRRSVERAVKVNATFPHALAEAAERTGCRVIQIATDCVFSGRSGPYSESDSHDPIDIYGKTKSLGEVQSPAVRHLRCSIIGPELKSHRSLLDWFLSQPQDAAIKGYTNHHWNGVTTSAFARLCDGIVSGRIEFSSLPSMQHVVPYNSVTKAELLRHFTYFYNRQDIRIEEVDAPEPVNRVLWSKNIDVNLRLWRAAGYETLPYIQQMIEEMVVYR